MAAEQLFAERGIDAVPIRDITGAAGVDVSAIHYHFGSKRALVLAILAVRAEELGRARAALLDEIEADPDPSLEDVIEALVRPALAMTDPPATPGAPATRHPGSYGPFLAAALAHPEIGPQVAPIFDVHTSRYLEALGRVTPHLTPPVRAVRHVLAKHLINTLPAVQLEMLSAWLEERAPGSDIDLVEELVAFLVAAFRAEP